MNLSEYLSEYLPIWGICILAGIGAGHLATLMLEGYRDHVARSTRKKLVREFIERWPEIIEKLAREVQKNPSDASQARCLARAILAELEEAKCKEKS